MIDIILILSVICILCRGIIFKQRNQNKLKTIIPGYNKYVLGQLCGKRKLGKCTGIFEILFFVVIFIKVLIEAYIINIAYKNNISDIQEIVNFIPNSVIFINNNFHYLIILVCIIYYILFVYLMRTFSEKNNTSTWWMLIWGTIPVIAYIYYAFICKVCYIPKELKKKKVRKKK